MLTLVSLMIVGVIAATAYFHRSMSPHTLLGYLLIFFMQSILIRNIFIDYDIGADTIDPWNSFLINLSIEQLVNGSLLYLAFVILFCFGFFLVPHKIHLDISRFICKKRQEINYEHAHKVLKYFTIISFLSLVYFIYLYIFANASSALEVTISSYRGISEDIESYNANGILRLLISWSSITGVIAFYYLVSKEANVEIEKKLKKKFKRIVYASIMISFFMAVFSQSRSSMIFSILNYLIIYRMITGKWNIIKYIIPASVVLVLLFYAMTSIRAGSGINNDYESLGITKLVAPIFLNNGGADVGKTVKIIDHFESKGEYLLGSSFTQLFASYIPRSIWQEKPVNLDTLIGFEVYGADTYGTGAVPPGLPAELFINFHYVGLLTGAIIFGMLGKLLHNEYIRKKETHFFPVVYILCFIYIPHAFVGSGFAQTMMGVINNFLGIYLITFAITKLRKIVL